MKTPQKQPFTYVFDMDSKELQKSFAAKSTKHDNATPLQYQRTDYVPMISPTWLADPSTPLTTEDLNY